MQASLWKRKKKRAWEDGKEVVLNQSHLNSLLSSDLENEKLICSCTQKQSCFFW